MFKIDNTQDSFLTLDTLGILVSVLAVSVSFVFALLRFRQQRIFALERNLDILQRLNETALSSKDNLQAAMKSIHPEAPFDEETARIIFFHYLRLNRLYRAWLLRKKWVLSRTDYRQVFDNYAGTLKSAQHLFDDLRHRGYPKDFIRDLKQEVTRADPVPLISNSKVDLEPQEGTK